MKQEKTKNLKKKGIISGIILACLLLSAGLGFPFFKGIFLERAVRQSIDELKQDYSEGAHGAKIEILAWDKGWKTSTIKWRVQSAALTAASGIDHLILVDRVDHGYSPKIISSTDFTKNAWYKNGMDRYLDGKNPLTVQTVYTLAGDIRSKVNIKAFTIIRDTDAIAVMSGSAVVQWQQEKKRLNVQLLWDGFKIDGKLELGMVKFTAGVAKTDRLIWEGTNDLSIDSAILTQDDRSRSFEKLSARYTISYNETNSTVSIHAKAGVDLLASGREDIRDMGVTLELKNLDSRALEQIVKSNRMEASDWAAILSRYKGPDQVVQHRIEGLRKALTDNWELFLKKGCEVQIKGLTATLVEGNISADLSLGLKKSMTLTGFLPVLLQPSRITDIFALSSRVKIPYQLVGYRPYLLEPFWDLMPTGLFVGKGPDLVHQAQIRDGKLFLNQQEVVLE